MKKSFFVLLIGVALLSLTLVLAGCTRDSNRGGCNCRAGGDKSGIDSAIVMVAEMPNGEVSTCSFASLYHGNC